MNLKPRQGQNDNGGRGKVRNRDNQSRIDKRRADAEAKRLKAETARIIEGMFG